VIDAAQGATSGDGSVAHCPEPRSREREHRDRAAMVVLDELDAVLGSSARDAMGARIGGW